MTNVYTQMDTTTATPGSPGLSRSTIEDWLKVTLRTPITRRTWAEAGYGLVAVPLAIVGFVFLVVSSAFGVVLLVTLLGLPVLALSGLGSRRLGRRPSKAGEGHVGRAGGAARRIPARPRNIGLAAVGFA